MEFKKLLEEIQQCNLCEETFGYKPRPIINGNQNAKIAQISQAPSLKVYETGIPFNDQSGKRLKYQWYQITDDIFYNPSNFYIVSLAHCYPGKNKNGGDKKPPKICFETWVKKEIALLENELFIIIGQKACQTLFPKQDFNQLVFKENILLNNKKAIVLPHPSPLNIKWFKDHPEFENECLNKLRSTIKELLQL